MNELHLLNSYFNRRIYNAEKFTDSSLFRVSILVPTIIYHKKSYNIDKATAYLHLFSRDDIFSNCMRWYRDQRPDILLSSFKCFNKILRSARPVQIKINREKIHE